MIEIRTDVPRSGWVITKIVGTIIIVNVIKIVAKLLILSVLTLWKYLAKHKIIPIFISSEGCKLRKYKSIHLLEPDALTPYSATQNKRPRTIR